VTEVTEVTGSIPRRFSHCIGVEGRDAVDLHAATVLTLLS
jgi:hypothetical protein